MDAMLGQKRFGAHGDVMSASPEDEAGKAKLFEEIKGRARAEFGRKNLPQAEMLYCKGLEMMPNDATLHGNLAAVRLGLNKLQAALENSEKAVSLDPGYAKGYYRKGQALMALSRPAEAAEVFRVGAKLEPESKLWRPLVDKAVKAAEVGPPAARVSSKTTSSNGGTVAASSRTPAPAQVTGGKAPFAADSSVKKSSAKTSTFSNMKGYKKTADGRVTTYFNNELSEEAKALIGNIAPQKLEAAKAMGDDASNGPFCNDISAWNKAGTWESRDMTSWAKQRLDELLKGVEFETPESSVTVVKIENLEGDAEISFSRGKKRYMFDFRFELKWEALDLDEGPAKGVLAYPDVGQDCDGVYDVECRVDSSTPIEARSFVDRHVRHEQSGLKQAVLARLVIFAEEFHSK